MEQRTALVLGATGMVGGQCLQQLLQNTHYKKVITLTRKTLQVNHPKHENRVVDFDAISTATDFVTADDVFCTLGTTIAKAGSQQAFKRVDYEYPLAIAQKALWKGAQRFILVSAVGANAGSGIFYSRVKGELEDALAALGYQSLVILRPSILLGDRGESRPGEAIGMLVAEKFSFLFAGPLKRYKGISAATVAAGMVNAALKGSKGKTILENEAIFDWAVK